MKNILYSMALEHEGNWLDIYHDLETRYIPGDIKTAPKGYVSIIDDTYPDFMKGYYKPAFLLIHKNGKWYVPYGKELKKRFEVKPNAEEKYIADLKKYC